MQVLNFFIADKDIDIDVCYCGNEICEDGFSYGPEVRSEYLIHFVLKGNGFLKKGNKIYRVNEGDCFLIVPGEVTTYWCEELPSWSFCWVAFNGKNVTKYLNAIKLSAEEPVKHIGNVIAEQVKNKILSLSCVPSFKGASRTWRLSYLYGILSLIELANAEDEKKTAESEMHVKKALLYIKYNYNHKMNVNDIADALRLNRSYFSRIFKQYTKIQPSEYITQFRIKKSMELMNTTDMTVSEIAKSVGIEESHYFSRMFKKHTGVSPTKYKEELK